MRLVVDSNRFIAALIKDGLSRTIISSRNLSFYSPSYVLEEVEKYLPYIIKKSRMSKENIELLFALFSENIETVSDNDIKRKMPEAIKIMENIDINDAPILACALAIRNQGIWTEDRHFEKQDKVRMWKSADLLDHL
ncbi:MAG: PIN domain-containing protein [Nanoarchaeota archaeon]